MNVRTCLITAAVGVWLAAGNVMAQTEPVAESVQPARTLTTLAAVHDRLRKGDTNDYEIDLTANVSYWDRSWQSLFVQDDETAVFVQLPQQDYARVSDLALGDVLHVKGTFNPSRYVIFASSVDRVSAGNPAPAMAFDAGAEVLGSHWSRRVRVEGIVESTLIGADRMQLIVRSGTRRFFVRAHADPEVEAPAAGDRISLTGALAYLPDENDAAYVALIHQMPADELRVLTPSVSSASVEYVSDYSLLHRDLVLGDEADSGEGEPEGRQYEVHGQVCYIHGYEFLILENKEGQSLSIYAPFAGDLHVGDVVRVTGVKLIGKSPNFDKRSPIRLGYDHLGDQANLAAQRVIIATTAPVRPAPRSTIGRIVDERRSRIRADVKGQLLSVRQVGDHWELAIGEDGRGIICEVPNLVFESSKLNLERAYEIEAVGIVFPPETAGGHYRLRVSDMSDVRVTKTTPGINRSTAIYVLGTMLLIGLVSIVLFRAMLRRRDRALVRLASRLESSHEAVSEGMLIVDQRGLVVGASPRLIELLKLDTTALEQASGSLESIGRVLAGRFRGTDFIDFWLRANELPRVVEHQEFQTVDSLPRTIVANTTPVYDTYGAIDARIWAFDDITSQKRLEANLLQAQKMDAVGQLVGGVAHDFNNMLTVVKVNLMLLRNQPKSTVGEVISIIDEAGKAVDIAADLAGNLLTFSHKSDLTVRTSNVNEVVQQMCSLLKRSLTSECTLSVDFSSDLRQCKIDANYVVQALLNICLNARDALAAGGGGTIYVSTCNVPAEELQESPLSVCRASGESEPDSYVRIRVQDTGDGIPIELQASVFEPFFTTKPQGQGTGLGLATSRRIIQQHGGDILYRSQENQGACFDVLLPAVSSDAASI